MPRSDDEEDIIGDRPKPPPIEKQLDGLGLFADLLDQPLSPEEREDIHVVLYGNPRATDLPTGTIVCVEPVDAKPVVLEDCAACHQAIGAGEKHWVKPGPPLERLHLRCAAAVDLQIRAIVEGVQEEEPKGLLPQPSRIVEPRRAKPTQLPPLTAREKERLEAIERLKELVEPKLLELAKARKDRVEAPGVTADDVFLLVMRFPQAALLGSEQRSLSWGGPWLSTLANLGKLVAFKISGVPVLRRSTRKEARRNRQQVYLHPEDFRAAQ